VLAVLVQTPFRKEFGDFRADRLYILTTLLGKCGSFPGMEKSVQTKDSKAKILLIVTLT
jgi:hypothetical protein